MYSAIFVFDIYKIPKYHNLWRVFESVIFHIWTDVDITHHGPANTVILEKENKGRGTELLLLLYQKINMDWFHLKKKQLVNKIIKKLKICLLKTKRVKNIKKSNNTRSVIYF
jgi:hypothetical protein